jgi:hypothetical protein
MLVGTNLVDRVYKLIRAVNPRGEIEPADHFGKVTVIGEADHRRNNQLIEEYGARCEKEDPPRIQHRLSLAPSRFPGGRRGCSGTIRPAKPFVASARLARAAYFG